MSMHHIKSLTTHKFKNHLFEYTHMYGESILSLRQHLLKGNHHQHDTARQKSYQLKELS